MTAAFWVASSSASGSWGIRQGVALPVAPRAPASSVVSRIRSLSCLPPTVIVFSCTRLAVENDPGHLSLVVRMSSTESPVPGVEYNRSMAY